MRCASLGSRGWDIGSPATHFAPCATRWTRGAPMAGFFSALTASSSRVMAGRTPRASPARSRSATTWFARNCSEKFAKWSGNPTKPVRPPPRQQRREFAAPLGTPPFMTDLKLRSVVRGVGAYLPKRILSNAELAERVNTSDEWIEQRTGIRQRHIAAEGQTTSHLGTRAAEMALAHAGLTAADIDLVIVATSTPDYTFPAVATQIQANLHMDQGVAFDLQAVCTGFVFAVATADKFLISGSHRRALVIGAETFSRLLDWTDRTTCVLFGDGAGAIVLEAVASEGALHSQGVVCSQLRSDGRHRAKLYVDGGPSTTKTVGHLRMEGREVFKHAVGMVTDVVHDALKETGFSVADIDWFIPHQANKRIIDGSAHKLGIAPTKVVSTVDRHGNTSAASIPLALADAVADRRIKRGDLLLLEAMGGGFTWGAALVRW